MHNCMINKRARLLIIPVLLVMLCAGRVFAQKIDLNVNGLSDVWEAMFQTGGLNPAGDADQDGVSNQLEALAGTDPFDSNSVPRLSFALLSPTNFSMSMPSALGKHYQWQSVSGLNPTNWIVEANVVARTGTVVTLKSRYDNVAKFFRLVISDVDTDGDGINDWEEYKLGLDPESDSSNGQLDVNGQPLNDYAFATEIMASQNVVTIVASDPAATQPDV